MITTSRADFYRVLLVAVIGLVVMVKVMVGVDGLRDPNRNPNQQRPVTTDNGWTYLDGNESHRKTIGDTSSPFLFRQTFAIDFSTSDYDDHDGTDDDPPHHQQYQQQQQQQQQHHRQRQDARNGSNPLEAKPDSDQQQSANNNAQQRSQQQRSQQRQQQQQRDRHQQQQQQRETDSSHMSSEARSFSSFTTRDALANSWMLLTSASSSQESSIDTTTYGSIFATSMMSYVVVYDDSPRWKTTQDDEDSDHDDDNDNDDDDDGHSSMLSNASIRRSRILATEYMGNDNNNNDNNNNNNDSEDTGRKTRRSIPIQDSESTMKSCHSLWAWLPQPQQWYHHQRLLQTNQNGAVELLRYPKSSQTGRKTTTIGRTTRTTTTTRIFMPCYIKLHRRLKASIDEKNNECIDCVDHERTPTTTTTSSGLLSWCMQVRGGGGGGIAATTTATTKKTTTTLGNEMIQKLIVTALVTLIFEGLIGHVLEFLKIVMQTAVTGTTYLQVIQTITAAKGLAGLWDGFIPWGVVQAVFKGAVFGLAHTAALRLLVPLADDPKRIISHKLAQTLAGGIGGGIQGFVLSPTLLLKTRVMTNPIFREKMSAWRTTWLSFGIGFDVVRMEGLSTLMKGSVVFATKRVFDWASRYYFADLFETILIQIKHDQSLSIGEKSIASLLGGFASTCVTLPLDVLVAKIQDAKKAGVSVSAMTLFRNELHEKGWIGLCDAYMRGFEARLLHVCLTTVVIKTGTPLVYDALFGRSS